MGSAQPTPYQGSCLILHTSQRAALPACWLPCYPGKCSSNQPWLTLYLRWVPSPCAYKDLTVFYYCSPTVLCHSIAAPQHFPLHFHCSQLLSLCRPFCSLSGWVSVSLHYCFSLYLPLTFALLSSSPILHETFPDPLLRFPYCAPSRDSLHRKAQLFARYVLEGRDWGLGGVGEVPRGFEGDKNHVHFQTLPADAPESSLLLLLVFYSWSSPRSGTILPPTPLGRGIQHGTTNQEGSGLAFLFQPLVFPHL